MHRRTLIAATAAATAAALAGCSGDDPPDEPEPGDWFDDVPHYDGFADRTDADEVTVLVGAGESGFRFDPPAVAVAPGTTVIFEWTGEGGEHEVADPDGDWGNPEGLIDEAGHTYERTFEEPGTHRYECWPHAGLGMKGAVFVDANADR